jgi:hypothetical protein
MTKGVKARTASSTFFDDAPRVNQLDALFAELYFDASDNWEAGRIDHVPPAWQMAFAAGETGTTSPMTDLLLGMNAHISRDLAYAVAQLLESQPGGPQAPGRTDRADFDRVNEVIDEVSQPMLTGAAARFDPSIGDLDLALSDTALAPLADHLDFSSIDSTQLIALWRTQAFQMAERLAVADTPEARLAVEAEIERNAAAIATLILNADGAMGAGLRGDARADHCAQALADRS